MWCSCRATARCLAVYSRALWSRARAVNPQVPGSSPGRGARFRPEGWPRAGPFSFPAPLFCNLSRPRPTREQAGAGIGVDGRVRKWTCPNRKPLVRTVSPERLRAVASEHAVLDLVRDYLGDWLPEELAQLPDECRPGKLRDAEDLGSLGVSLAWAVHSFGLPPETARAVEEMDVFVGLACRRLAELRHLEQAAPSARTPSRYRSESTSAQASPR